MKSLERQFVIGLAVILLLAFGLLLWASVNAVRSLSEAYVAARLEHDAEALLGAVWVNPHGRIRLREGRITPIYQQPLSGHYYQLTFGDQEPLRSRSLWDERLATISLAPGEISTFHAPGPAGQQLQLRAAGYEKAARRFTLTVAEDTTPMALQIRRFQVLALSALGLTLLLILLLQRYVLRRGFRVLQQVADAVRGVTAGQADRLEEFGPAEVRPLTVEIDRLLGQLQLRLQRSRQGLGNLAHALKAPLSLMTRELEHLDGSAAQRDRLSVQLARLGGLIERALKRARLGGEGSAQRFLPGRHVPDLLDAIRQLHRQRAVQIDCAQLPAGATPFDREDMLELLGNLLDNACKWATHQVRLELLLGQVMTIRIADDGPGIAAVDRDALLRRGSRLDEQMPGHGLGLAIVSDLVRDYAGTLSLAEDDQLGGLLVTVVLPLPDSAKGT